jgi:hypothetical protein
LLAPLALLLLAAADPIPVADQWKQPDLGPVEFRKILVVGITDDRATRNNFEGKFCSHLRAFVTECVVSNSLVPDLGHIAAEERIKAQIVDQKIDAALTVRLVPLPDGNADRWSEQWSSMLEGDRRLRALIEESLPISDGKSKHYGVDVGLWQVDGGARIWAGRSDVVSRKRLNKGKSGSFIESVIHQLRRVDLI